MNTASKDSSAASAHLRQAQKRRSSATAVLDGEPELYPAVQHIWSWFIQLANRRGGSFGPAPLTWCEIDSWARRMNIRVRGFSGASYTTMVSGADTGTINAWTAEAIAAGIANYPANWTYIFTSLKSAQYWQIELTDTANSAGYIELGRAWLGVANFEPEIGVSYGMGLGYESRDVIEGSLGGVPWGEKRTPRRYLTATFESLTAAEKRQALIQQKTLTTTDEALRITNGLATAEDMLLEAFPCFLKQLSPLNYPYFGNNDMGIEIVERI
jgi:hypothetical protein